ncbi:hypothetical protein APL45_gp08 [Escherichia phage vB_EcoP_24B]|uniref:Uncharacterized protein n=1 Tax=Escherichia phage vB_EcoP_24B TaxID=866553 RepID=G3CFH3_9CAUD|nr:hypothetical protein APL45_gp08 [Escherichia phage vB_EcoP_24B]ADN68395.1 hypothetical protein vb_24B_5c [Escherichia phage vB_EcoP_24B]
MDNSWCVVETVTLDAATGTAAGG